jgi:protein subunit release factor A
MSPTDMASLSKELAQLEPQVHAWNNLECKLEELKELRELSNDADSDADMRKYAADEIETLTESVDSQEKTVARMILPRDEADATGAVILEVRNHS